MAGSAWNGGRFVAHAIGAWAVLFGFYVLFTFSGQSAELVSGGIAAGLAAAFGMAVRRNSERQMWITWPALHPLVPAIGGLVRDTWRISGVLLAAIVGPTPRGGFRAEPYPDGAVIGTAGRAIAVAAVSLPPNSFVVGGDTGEGQLSMHQLLPEKPERAR